MSFKYYLKHHTITEWKDFYINYDLLKSILLPFHKTHHSLNQKLPISNSQSHNSLTETLLPIRYKDLAIEEEVNLTKKKFYDQLSLETAKFDFFVKETYSKFQSRLESIIEQLQYVKQRKEFKIFLSQLETEFKSCYKDIIALDNYVQTNIKIKDAIKEKYIKYTLHGEHFKDLEKAIIKANQILFEANTLVKKQIKESETHFAFFFHEKYDMHPIKVLKMYLEKEAFTAKEAFNLGILIGMLLFIMVTVVIIGHITKIDIDSDMEFKSIIPMFRTFGILCIYIWTLGLNVLAWEKANINYKALFNFDDHYSDVLSIFNRSVFFSILLFGSLLLYLIIRANIPIFVFLNNNVAVGILPLICWSTLLLYFFCPFKIFNYQGRFYTMKLFLESVASIFVPTSFRHVWFMDQLTSLIGPMRDMEYTLCYYSYYVDPLQVRQIFCGNTRGIYLFIAIFPNFIRILQCIRIIIDSKMISPQIFNIGKYLFNIIVATFSFLSFFNPSLFYAWLVSAFISGCYSSFWDIKFDFGFFQQGTNYPLRDKLTYKNHCIYYFTIIANIFLRFLWVLTVSPEIMGQMIRPELLALILFTLEMMRRGMWNFIRVEFEHLDLKKKFQISYYEDLPFIKQNGELLVNERNILTIIHYDKEEKIKLELNQVFKQSRTVEIKKNKSRPKAEVNPSSKLEEYLKEYIKNTKSIIGGV